MNGGWAFKSIRYFDLALAGGSKPRLPLCEADLRRLGFSLRRQTSRLMLPRFQSPEQLPNALNTLWILSAMNEYRPVPY